MKDRSNAIGNNTTAIAYGAQRACRASALVTAVLLATSSSALAEGLIYRLVAITGDAAPGSLNGTFSGLGHPQLNASGQVAFVASTTGTLADTGIWKTRFDNPQQLLLVIGEDYPLPASPAGFHFGSFISSNHHPLLLDDGIVDGLDLGILLGSWGTPGPIGTGGDVDLDGDTDGADLGALLGGWGVCRG